MKNVVLILLLSGFLTGLLSSCAGGGGSVVYRHNYGFGGWRGYHGYVDRRPIVVVPPGPEDKDGAANLPVYPDNESPKLEAVPFEQEPMMDMDMGMPDLLD